jgi:hypothetical protein
MKTRKHNFPSRGAGRRSTGGVSLIAMIGIVAIVGIFAVVLLRELLREIDHAVSRQESAALEAQQGAIEQSIMRTGAIPGPTNWANAVAAELGAQVATVATNPRRHTRNLLVDTNGWLQSGVLPYTQTVAGVTNPPQPLNARMMIVSSLGTSPPALGNYPAATEFAALWNCRDGQVPTAGAWAGWNGRPADIKVKRILLDPLFVELRLVTGKSEPQYGQYSIGAAAPLLFAPRQQLSNNPRYLLRGTMVWLYTDVNRFSRLDARMILTKNAFYRYEDGVWKAGAVGADLPGGLDLAAVVKGFLDAIPNTNAFNGALQQTMVVDSMMAYMRGYIAWQAGSGVTRDDMLVMQDNMMTTCGVLFMDSLNGKSYFPINAGACQ